MVLQRLIIEYGDSNEFENIVFNLDRERIPSLFDRCFSKSGRMPAGISCFGCDPWPLLRYTTALQSNSCVKSNLVVTKHELPYISSAFLYGWTCVQPVCRFLQLSRHPSLLTIFPFSFITAQLPWFMPLCNTYTIFLHSTALNSDLWRRHCDCLTIKVIISRQEATSQVRDRQLWDWRCSQRCCSRFSFLGMWRRVGRAVPDVSSYPGTMESSDW